VEHRLVQGGESFLPFARCCVAKLKRLGLPYADQSYEVDGVSIKVRIQPGHEYIRLEAGGKLDIVSGAIQNGNLVDTDIDGKTVKVLHTFRPTPECWAGRKAYKDTYPIDTYFPEKKLGVVSAVSVPTSTYSQNVDLSGSMYSGRMAKVVQLLMGIGKFNVGGKPDYLTDGLQIKYEFWWGNTHGITMSEDNTPWLIWISKDEGILAMPLPRFAQSEIGASKAKLTASSDNATKQLGILTGGVPTGEVFPTGEQFTDALADGSILRLKTASEMEVFYGNISLEKTGFDESVGWAFNSDGSEAQNITFYTDPSERPAPYEPGFPNYRAARFKLAFTIGVINKDHEPGDPIADASVVITEEENKPRDALAPFFCGRAVSSYVLAASGVPKDSHGAPIVSLYPTSWPAYCCYYNDVIDVVRVECFLQAIDDQTLPFQRIVTARYPASGRDPASTIYAVESTDIGYLFSAFDSTIPGFTGTQTIQFDEHAMYLDYRVPGSICYIPVRARESYAIYESAYRLLPFTGEASVQYLNGSRVSNSEQADVTKILDEGTEKRILFTPGGTLVTENALESYTHHQTVSGSTVIDTYTSTPVVPRIMGFNGTSNVDTPYYVRYSTVGSDMPVIAQHKVGGIGDSARDYDHAGVILSDLESFESTVDRFAFVGYV